MCNLKGAGVGEGKDHDYLALFYPPQLHSAGSYIMGSDKLFVEWVNEEQAWVMF